MTETEIPGNRRGIRRLINAARWSMKGFRSTFRHEAAFRQELMLLGILAPIGYLMGDNGVERAILIGSLLIVLLVELLNSALESVVDRIGPERHRLSGRAKDQGSAAVFLALVLALVSWMLVLTG